MAGVRGRGRGAILVAAECYGLVSWFFEQECYAEDFERVVWVRGIIWMIAAVWSMSIDHFAVGAAAVEGSLLLLLSSDEEE